MFSQLDCEILGVDNVESKAQQAFEALSLLIALRLWLPRFPHNRVRVKVRGDNMAALSLLTKMQPKSQSLQVVARELALDIAMTSFTPDFVEHVAGISNTVADTLSRKTELGHSYRLPVILTNCEFTNSGTRLREWWVTKRADDILS